LSWIIFEDDSEGFGDIVCCNSTINQEQEEETGFTQKKLEGDFSHLTVEQQNEVKDLIWSHKEMFNDRPGMCNLAEHEIELEAGFKPKAMRAYRITNKMKT